MAEATSAIPVGVYPYLTVKGGKAALEMLESEHVDVVLTYLVMRDIDGMEILTTARRLHPDIEVVVMTGFASVAHEDEGASMTVTMVSNRARLDRTKPSSNSQLKVAATGIGSEMPVDSITI